MNTLAEDYQNHIANAETIRNSMVSYRDQFYNFLQNNDTKDHLDISLSVNDWIKVEDYEICLEPEAGDLAKGIRFEHVEQDYDCEIVSYFYVPFAYMVSPSVWEANLMSYILESEEAALKKFYDVFPNFKGDVESNRATILVSSANYLSDDWDSSTGYLSIEFHRRNNIPIGYHFSYDGVIYNTSRLLYSIKEDALYLSRRLPTSAWEKDAYKLTHALTPAEAEYLPRGAKAENRETISVKSIPYHYPDALPFPPIK